jgi:cytochrome c oxidase subunit 1/cytochrome c oxidase subunit I+III
MMNETWGKWSFWVMFIGFNLGFFPMHLAGLLGMPRRIYTYAPHMGWSTVNLVTSIGSFIFAAGISIFLVNIMISLRRGALAKANPWDAPTLEWATSSPPPAYNFAVIPFIASRHPLWEDRLVDARSRSSLEKGYLLMEGRETIGTTPLDAKPDIILKMPDDSYTPFFLGLFSALAFTGLLLDWSNFTILMTVAGTISLAVWMWPRKSLIQRTPGGMPDKG